MTVNQAIEILQGPRQAELQQLIDEFQSWGGYTLAHHPRQFHFGAFALWLEERWGLQAPEGG